MAPKHGGEIVGMPMLPGLSQTVGYKVFPVKYTVPFNGSTPSNGTACAVEFAEKSSAKAATTPNSFFVMTQPSYLLSN
jgi:hypothetical protein